MTREVGKPSLQGTLVCHGFSRKSGFSGSLRGTVGEKEAQRTEGQHKAAKGIVRCGCLAFPKQLEESCGFWDRAVDAVTSRDRIEPYYLNSLS